MPFKITRPDGRSYRDVAVEALKDRPPGTLMSFEELGRILTLDPERERSRIRAAVHAAQKPMLKLHKRGLKAVPSKGYRILAANEHAIAAGDHQGKAHRAMQRALTFYEGTNLAELTDIERKLHDGQYILAQAIIASHQHLDQRIKRIEALLRGGETIETS